MPLDIDPAILRALQTTLKIDQSAATLSKHGGSGFAETLRISTPTTSIFVKTATSPGAAVMFEGEHASLNAIHDAVPSLCPKAYAWGKLDKRDGYFLATEFLDLGGRRLTTASSGTSDGSGLSLAQKMAKLHSTPAPIPEGYDMPMFGFPVTTCCGDTPQDNSFRESWANFFAENRLLMILQRSEKNNGKDAELRKVVERTATEVVPRLLGEGHLGGKEGIKPVVVHGDLWSGNKGKGSFVGRDGAGPDQPGPVEEVVFDPSAVYAHNEYEIGIQMMFGGFGSAHFKEYHELVPKTEPAEEYEVSEDAAGAACADKEQDRVALYESYHHLNHHSIFGGGYKSGAMNILKRLIKKYGNT
ncbi:Ketosamine-3-kinase [Cyphellophora attinorum]|uniref:protein-ribulosamine 3-kinase n=1 Tax=Cyphellophora attinorum TaxID=1664694 RepID=A0A0N1HFI2_9EURO|nr:Ketosamine-3-kinase [Phialophora attinorum]KPI44520.1 Ketosamine-3-kinase [Phialophora attinorum]